MKKWLLTNE